jgi:hypothetical protein
LKEIETLTSKEIKKDWNSVMLIFDLLNWEDKPQESFLGEGN